MYAADMQFRVSFFWMWQQEIPGIVQPKVTASTIWYAGIKTETPQFVKHFTEDLKNPPFIRAKFQPQIHAQGSH